MTNTFYEKIYRFLFFLIPIIFLFPVSFSTIACLFYILFFFLTKRKFEIKLRFEKNELILLLFFLLIIFSSLLEWLLNSRIYKINNLENFFKFVGIIRFFLIYFLVKKIIDKKIYLVSEFFKSSFFSTVFIITNIFLMHVIGRDIFGNIPLYGGSRYATTFGDRAIAGTYLLNFFFFGYIFLLRKKINIILILFYLALVGLAILLTLDRTPFVLFNIFLILLFCLNYRKHFLIFFLLFIYNILIFLFFISINSELKSKYMAKEFLIYKQLSTDEIQKITNTQSKNVKEKNVIEGVYVPQIYSYRLLYEESIHIFIYDKTFLGSGAKSFYQRCGDYRFNTDKFSRQMGYYKACQSHTHNLYLEISISSGLIGLFLFIYFIFSTFFKLKILRKYLFQNQIFIILIISLIIELFPFRPYGMFLSTYNGFYLFFKLAILSSLIINFKKFNKL